MLYKKNIINIIIDWLLVFLWLSLIFYLSSIPGLSSGWDVFWDVLWRKFAHAGEFMILNWLLYRALKKSFKLNFPCLLFLSFAFSVFYAVFDEIHQFFVPARQCRLLDVGIDSLGACFGSLIILFSRIINYI